MTTEADRLQMTSRDAHAIICLMEKLRKLLTEYLNEDLDQIVISRPRDRKAAVSKIKVRPILLKGCLLFQETAFDGPKALHKNHDKSVMIERIMTLMDKDYVQIELAAQGFNATGLVNRKGELSLKTRMKDDGPGKSIRPRKSLEHDRSKRRILEEGKPVGFLVDLGLMKEDGSVIKAGFDKYRQINRFLEYIEDITDELPKDREVNILDFGCGKSYLTFAVYHYLKELMGFDVRITGLDLKEDVIRKCNELRDKYGYDKLNFVCGDVADYFDGCPGGCDLMLTLHACDIATDHALYNGIMRGAHVILSVPCCQHEVNKQIDSILLDPVMKYGIIKERMSSLITDGIRAELLRAYGYEVKLLEFIDMEHTPKNILIRAVKRVAGIKDAGTAPLPEELLNMMDEMKIRPALYRMLSVDR